MLHLLFFYMLVISSSFQSSVSVFWHLLSSFLLAFDTISPEYATFSGSSFWEIHFLAEIRLIDLLYHACLHFFFSFHVCGLALLKLTLCNTDKHRKRYIINEVIWSNFDYILGFSLCLVCARMFMHPDVGVLSLGVFLCYLAIPPGFGGRISARASHQKWEERGFNKPEQLLKITLLVRLYCALSRSALLLLPCHPQSTCIFLQTAVQRVISTDHYV